MHDAAPDITIVHNERAHRFEAVVPGKLCRAEYQRVGNTLHMYHTEVPYELRHHGIAGRLVQAALDYAAANGLKVMPLCSYVRAYIRRHPEAQRLVARS